MNKFIELLKKKSVLLSDGAWGTMLQAKGLGAGECPERWNLDHRDLVFSVAKGYAEAGSDMVETNSFGGSKIKLKEGQKLVFKVVRVDERKGHVDVSLRRVFDAEKRAKLSEWRRAQRAEKLLELAASKLGRTLDEAYEEAGWKLEDYYGEIYTGLEEAARRGVKALSKAGVSDEWAKVLAELAKAYIELPVAKVSGVFTITCFERDGVVRIKRALEEGLKVASRVRDVSVRMYTEGAPRYKIDLVAPDYKTAERCLREVVEAVLKTAEGEVIEVADQSLRELATAGGATIDYDLSRLAGELVGIQTAVPDLESVSKALTEAEVEVLSAELSRVPQTMVMLTEEEAVKLMRLLDALEDNDDVQKVFSIFDVSAETMEKLKGD